MSTDDDIFLAASEPLATTVDWLSRTLGLEPLEDPDLEEAAYLFLGRARTTDGELVFVVEPNTYGEVDPEPEDVSAIDRYTGVVEVRLVGKRDEELQAREAHAVFDELAGGRPDVALVLSHALSLIVAAYLPGAGVHSFPPGTTLDVPDDVLWRPWVVS
ncbi:hypothetical protein ACIBL3_46320 [Kribbella sp. NPDC050124]|uniref:hypothetical protein n=1 Tax=Kribbella sp. NPDC050124 TaxID=3364114 RepID=UPI00379D846B